MILCVTLNPCLDKTLTVPPWLVGDSVRGTAVREVVGGKGNNVARALARLGRPARPVTFLGGTVGAHCESLLRNDDGFDPLITPTAASTRTILTVRTESSPLQTAFFDPDPDVSATEAAAMIHRVEGALTAEGVTGLTLSGSSPSPATDSLFSDLIGLARARKIPIFLDTYGSSLDEIWGFWPQAIKINRREAAEFLRIPSPTDADIFALLARWSKRGVSCAVITDGPRPAQALVHGLRYVVTPPPIDVLNPIGSGDCLLAGLADAFLNGLPPEGLLRHGFACASANALVWDAGAIDAGEVERLREKVVIETLGRG